MRVQEHVSPRTRAKFCREFRRYREYLVRAAKAREEFAALVAKRWREGVRS